MAKGILMFIHMYDKGMSSILIFIYDVAVIETLFQSVVVVLIRVFC